MRCARSLMLAALLGCAALSVLLASVLHRRLRGGSARLMQRAPAMDRFSGSGRAGSERASVQLAAQAPGAAPVAAGVRRSPHLEDALIPGSHVEALFRDGRELPGPTYLPSAVSAWLLPAFLDGAILAGDCLTRTCLGRLVSCTAALRFRFWREKQTHAAAVRPPRRGGGGDYARRICAPCPGERERDGRAKGGGGLWSAPSTIPSLYEGRAGDSPCSD